MSGCFTPHTLSPWTSRHFIGINDFISLSKCHSGLAPFAEHELAELSADSYQLEIRYPCERCIVTTIDQGTGVKDPQKQPFKTLQAINPMPGSNKGPAFAENATLSRGERQIITVGDHIEAIFK